MTDPHPTEFTLTVLRAAGTLTVRVGGELDYDTSDGLTDMLVRHLTTDEAGLSDVRLDFRDLTWIDSSGLTALDGPSPYRGRRRHAAPGPPARRPEAPAAPDERAGTPHRPRDGRGDPGQAPENREE
ncbi:MULTISPECIES: STAS domain-containing protein [Streptomyces]|uniref:STAS domain-containing protein n=1 Tax=Streptomyces flaveolus TaxID=67297 RepID=A0ABV3AH31_9ACTN|nr:MULTISPECIES: STAS domain-containing protein [Streptomyces]